MALTRITKGVIKPNENYDTHNINSTGIVTAIGLDINGNGDVSGNLSVGGVLTYEDVTSIDSVGIITARDGIHVGAGVSAVGVITASSFHGDGSNLTGIDATALKDPAGNVKIQAQASGAVHTGVTTISQNLALNASGTTYPLVVHADADYKGIMVNGSYAPTIGFNILDNATPSWKLGIHGSSHHNFALSTGTGNSNKLIIQGASTGGKGLFYGDWYATNLSAAGNLYQYDDTDTMLSFGYPTLPDTINLKTGGTTRLSVENSGIIVTGVSTFTGASTFNSETTTVKLKVNSVNAQIDLTSGQNSFTRYGAINHYHNNSTSTIHNQIKFAPRNGGTGRIMFYNLTGGSLTERLRIDGTDGIQAIAHIIPMSDNLYALGGSATRWSSVTSRSLFLIDTDDGSAAGPELKLYRNSASPADADYLGQIKFAGESDTGVERNYAKITGKILDASNGTEDGILEFAHIKAGSQNISARFRSDSLQLLNDTNLSVAGDTTLTGDLDVDGHTNLDNVSVAGVSTITGISNHSSRIQMYAGNAVRFLNSGNSASTEIFCNGGAKLNITSYNQTMATFENGQPTIFYTDSGQNRLQINNNGNIIASSSNVTQSVSSGAAIFKVETTATSGDALIQASGEDGSGNTRMIQMRTDAGASQYRIISSDTSYSLALCTGNAPRVLIAGNSAATSIGGANTFNAMLTTQGDISGGLLMLKATENTSRFFVTGNDSTGCAVNLYDETGSQKGILGVSGSEFFIKAPHSSAPMKFYTHNGSSMTEKVRINTDGSVYFSDNLASTVPQGQFGFRMDRGGGNGTRLHIENLSNDSVNNNAELRLVTNHSNVRMVHHNQGGFYVINSGNGYLHYYSNGSSRVFIDTNGNVCVGTQSASSSTQAKGISLNQDGAIISRRDGVMQYYKSISTGGYYANIFLSANTTVGSIFFNSGGTQFNTSSDYRRKENVVSLTDGISKLKQLKPYRFNFKDNPSETIDGFLAHEAQEIVPHTVTGTKDQVSNADDVVAGIATTTGEPIYQQMDLSKLVPLLTASLQEAISKIETLEAKVAALEGS